MNKQTLNKLKLIFNGSTSRFDDNTTIFKGITVNYNAGLKNLKVLENMRRDHKVHLQRQNRTFTQARAIK